MVVLAWAASFGIDEYGITVNSANVPSTSAGGLTSQSRSSFREAQRTRTNTLVDGILSLVDTYGLLRNPTWDGARLLLLVWPLTQGTQRTLERTVRQLLQHFSLSVTDIAVKDDVRVYCLTGSRPLSLWKRRYHTT
jgi:hypothetical protein